MSDSPKRSSVQKGRPSEDLAFVLEEYKILQGKIDKIGDFKFRVRGWALTLTLGLVVAGLSTEEISSLLIAVAGPVLVGLFWFLEQEAA